MPDPKVEKHLRMLSALPSDFRKLADWGWTKLKPEIERQARDHGATPEEASQIAARLSRLVCAQIYGDIKRARTMTTISS